MPLFPGELGADKRPCMLVCIHHKQNLSHLGNKYYVNEVNNNCLTTYTLKRLCNFNGCPFLQNLCIFPKPRASLLKHGNTSQLHSWSRIFPQISTPVYIYLNWGTIQTWNMLRLHYFSPQDLPDQTIQHFMSTFIQVGVNPLPGQSNDSQVVDRKLCVNASTTARVISRILISSLPANHCQ